MSEHAQNFITHLQSLKENNPGALATLRHSLAFPPGVYEKAFPYVERFASPDWHARDPRRLALYVVAGLFARHPQHGSQSLAQAWAALLRFRHELQPGSNDAGKSSVEKRFVALLGADPENVADYLRQAVSLLASSDIAFDYVSLLNDLGWWMSTSAAPERRDQIRQRWARDYYRPASSPTNPEPAVTTKEA